ncbi:hypothetical protein LK994_11280 [Ferruginibacter lapsinanis]|uniref:hypothetical protein n=1 Tax=Ferruginibacter lapsinanis TaxID=563172 RepID=UPI001E48B08C|nr:hypothetical protein [Ferruginibacter lapsinanis]UEG49212.1 hypothetical protein LK994_11280 [Ferruginibacter lapsinanis]
MTSKYLYLATLFFCLLVNTTNAQKTKLIEGKWKFKDVADKEKLDSMTLKQANVIFRNTEMDFAADGKYLYNSLKGTWKFNKEENKVIVTMNNPLRPDDKSISEWEIKGLTNKELKLNMGKAVIILNRPPQQITTTAPPKQPINKNVEVVEVDKKAKQLFDMYTQQDAIHRPKIKTLLKYLEGSMKMDGQGNFNRSAWPYYSSQIKDTHCKGLFENIKSYQNELASLGLTRGQNELYDSLTTYLSAANSFVTSCSVWADNISQIDTDNETILSMLEILERNSNKMVKEDNWILVFISQYKQRNHL